MANLKDYERQVQLLIAEEKWQDAYKLCNEIITLDAENVTFIRLRNKVEKEVKKNNQKSIDNEIAKLEPLLKEKKYEEYLKKIAPLQSYTEDFPEIKEKILAAKKLLDQSFYNQREQAFQEQIASIKDQAQNFQYSPAIQQIEQLKKLNIQTEQLKKLEHDLKKKWLEYELKQNEGLLKSQKFEDIIIFLLKLKKTDPANSRINALIESTKNSYKLYKIDNKKDYIFKTIEEIKTLYIKKDYDKVLILCERVLEIDEKNPLVLRYQSNSIVKSRSDSNSKIEKQIFLNYSSFKDTPEFRDQNYISI